jgi:hypothetical protein
MDYTKKGIGSILFKKSYFQEVCAMKCLKTILMLAILIISAPGHADSNKVDYPDGYRQWAHIKSMLIEPGHPLENPFQGLHHVYGNKMALKGLKDGSFPDGSVLVFDLLQYNQAAHTIQEGERKLIGVMQKDKKAFRETGGWGFEAFSQNSKSDRIVGDGGKSCFACHTSQKDHDFVFSQFRK